MNSEINVHRLTAGHNLSFRTKTRNWLEAKRERLYDYRPRLRNRHFWVVQALVVGIAAVHDIIEAGGYLPHLGTLYFLPISLFFVPVVYAALNFGFAGSISTVIWAVIITIPNWLLWHHGLERFGVMFQMMVVVSVAIFVGQRVDQERSARRRLETAGIALKASEEKYRGLFESSPVAILVLDRDGAILDANPATSTLFNKTLPDLKDMTMEDLVGKENALKLVSSCRAGEPAQTPLVLNLKDDLEVYLEPTCTQVSESLNDFVIQVLLRDVTQEQHRQAGLKAYAAYVVRAQEEERQRIARELHDKTIQTLTILYRQLDGIEGAGDGLSGIALDRLREARRMTEDTVKELRDFAKALRPPILDDLGILTSIRRLLLDFTERSGVKSQLKLEGKERRLPPSVEVGVFRITQEALRNVERHAKATEVVITVAFDEDEARLNIKDNGVGFHVPTVLGSLSAGGQLGLLGMQERAEVLGGVLEVQSSPKYGTSVSVSIPITEKET